MDLFLLILGFLFCLIGIIGSFLPIIPGPVTAWLGILLLNLTSVVEFNLNFILITLTVAVSVGILDYLIPILGVKKLGGTRSGQIGTTVGLILALVILGPIGIIIGPFLGALLGEMTKEDISTWRGYLAAHASRRDFFIKHGAKATDHGHFTPKTYKQKY